MLLYGDKSFRFHNEEKVPVCIRRKNWLKEKSKLVNPACCSSVKLPGLSKGSRSECFLFSVRFRLEIADQPNSIMASSSSSLRGLRPMNSEPAVDMFVNPPLPPAAHGVALAPPSVSVSVNQQVRDKPRLARIPRKVKRMNSCEAFNLEFG